MVGAWVDARISMWAKHKIIIKKNQKKTKAFCVPRLRLQLFLSRKLHPAFLHFVCLKSLSIIYLQLKSRSPVLVIKETSICWGSSFKTVEPTGNLISVLETNRNRKMRTPTCARIYGHSYGDTFWEVWRISSAEVWQIIDDAWQNFTCYWLPKARKIFFGGKERERERM